MESKANQQNEIAALKARSQTLKVPYFDLTGKIIAVEVLKEIPEEAAAYYQFVPIGRHDNVLDVGMINPDDVKAREALRFIARRSELETRIYLISRTNFNEIIRQYRTLHGEVKKALRELEKELEDEVQAVKEKPLEVGKKITTDAPVTKIVAVILRHATEGRASDIHIEPLEAQLKVRFRVDGILHTSLYLPVEVHSAIVSRIKILATLKIDESRVPQDGRFRTVIDRKTIDFRVSTLPTTNGEKVVLRVLDPSVGLQTFADLGLTGYNLRVLEETISKPFGMLLITGPTGSGKTTTLYAILNSLNKDGTNIVSLEDPVEYYIEGINQSQIRPEIKYTFASGLRHILRQDPDVIMVGEIRDGETADLAIHASLTGHVLLSTLHTNNAIGVIPRLMDMGVGSFLLPATLNLAVAQRLVRRLCPKCKKEVVAAASLAATIEEEISKIPKKHLDELKIERPFKVYQAQGCKNCANKGTKGRIAIFEMIVMTPQLEDIIISGVTEAKLLEEAKRQDMISMRQDGILKVLQGVISFEEMLKVTEE